MDLFVASPLLFGIFAAEVVWDFCEYQYYKRILNSIKSAPLFDSSVAASLRSGQTLAYGIVRGTVSPLGQPIESVLKPGVLGHVQKLRVVRYLSSKGIFGSWHHSKEVVRDGIERTRFGLLCGNTLVHLSDSFAENLQQVYLERVGYEIRQMAEPSSGLHQVFEMTERMLKEGTEATAMGELTFDGVNFVMKIPSDGTSHFLTTGSVSAIEEGVDSALTTSKAYGIVSLAVVTAIAGSFLYQKWQEYTATRRYLETVAQMEMTLPEDDLPYTQRCVVCRYYARDIVLLPCRHYCLCKACLHSMNKHCPVCRSYFRTSIAVYVA